jgi:hypothetical protein
MASRTPFRVNFRFGDDPPGGDGERYAVTIYSSKIGCGPPCACLKRAGQAHPRHVCLGCHIDATGSANSLGDRLGTEHAGQEPQGGCDSHVAHTQNIPPASTE